MGGQNPTKIVTWLPQILTTKLEILRSNLELLKTIFPTRDLLIRAIGQSHNVLGRNLHMTEKALHVVRAYSKVLEVCEENIKKMMDFVLNHMELSVDFLAKHPRMFSMNLDKIMKPTFLVLQNMTAMDGTEKINPSRLCNILNLMFLTLLFPDARTTAPAFGLLFQVRSRRKRGVEGFTLSRKQATIAATVRSS